MICKYAYIYRNKIVVVLASGFMIICMSLQEGLEGRSIYIYIYVLVDSCWLCVLLDSAGDDMQYNDKNINARGVWPVKDLGTATFIISV